MENPQPTTVTTLSTNDREALKSMAQWARLLAIICFIGIGIMVIFSLVMSAMMATVMHGATAQQQALIEEAYTSGDMDGMASEGLFRQNAAVPAFANGLFLFFVIVFAVIYTIPSVYLYQFSVRVRKAIDGPFDPDLFTRSLHAHRRMYKFMGILTLVIIGLYLMLFVGATFISSALQQYRPPGG